ncbi:MAG: hypothetical protein V2A63_00140 [Patescibacteria group bacterium]
MPKKIAEIGPDIKNAKQNEGGGGPRSRGKEQDREWSSDLQNDLARKIKGKTKEELEKTKDALPVRVVQRGDTLDALTRGLLPKGEKFSRDLAVDYRSNRLKSEDKPKILRDHGADKIYPRQFVWIEKQDGKNVVVVADELPKIEPTIAAPPAPTAPAESPYDAPPDSTVVPTGPKEDILTPEQRERKTFMDKYRALAKKGNDLIDTIKGLLKTNERNSEFRREYGEDIFEGFAEFGDGFYETAKENFGSLQKKVEKLDRLVKSLSLTAEGQPAVPRSEITPADLDSVETPLPAVSDLSRELTKEEKTNFLRTIGFTDSDWNTATNLSREDWVALVAPDVGFLKSVELRFKFGIFGIEKARVWAQSSDGQKFLDSGAKNLKEWFEK